MRAHALTLHWHTDSQPIYSAHFQPSRSGNGRLATAGGDNSVRIWRVSLSDDGLFPSVTYLSTLVKHTQAVNVVRFDFSGEILASAGDDGNVILWSLADSDEPRHAFGEDPDERAHDHETWRIRHLCRSSMAEIYDLAWSPDSQYLIAGSMDNVARIYSAATGLCIRQIAEHNHYVQGVAWDPLNEYLATQSSDRSVHIYTLKSKDGQFALQQHHKISKAELPVGAKHVVDVDAAAAAPSTPASATSAPSSFPAVSESPSTSAPNTPSSFSMQPPPLSAHSRRSSFGNSPSVRRSPSPSPALPLPAVRQLDSPNLGFRMSQLYHNEGLTSFFRRLTFTPDGSLLLTPAGQFKHTNSATGVEETTNTVYIYTRAGLNKPPVAHLPFLKKPATVVRCSPVKYKLRTASESRRQTTNITIDSSAPDGLAIPSLSESALPPPPSIPSTSSTGAGAQQAFVLPYRIVYAVATQDSVFIYDTQQTTPLCVVSNLHYATFTDLTWSVDGRVLFMTSTDGFCSDVVFEPGELGEVYGGGECDADDEKKAAEAEMERESGTYYPPTPASTVDLELTTSTSSVVADAAPLPKPIISPVPNIAEHSTSSSSTAAQKREKETTEGAETGEKDAKKKRRIAPMLIGGVRKQ
ncbi:component of the chromatin assembly complex [Myxozyma melibiosi]|uniref:Component of the chromatin assembly complex n=1 Tax=Myxozyma melibiosi TaxID=54550 RepID=A0ABR1F7G4_9ASCO